ncbi:hypothetical protein ACFXTN_037910 [Malus domestica]
MQGCTVRRRPLHFTILSNPDHIRRPQDLIPELRPQLQRRLLPHRSSALPRLLPSNILFSGNHLATLFVFLTCRYVTLHSACATRLLAFARTSPTDWFGGFEFLLLRW